MVLNPSCSGTGNTVTAAKWLKRRLIEAFPWPQTAVPMVVAEPGEVVSLVLDVNNKIPKKITV